MKKYKILASILTSLLLLTSCSITKPNFKPGNNDNTSENDNNTKPDDTENKDPVGPETGGGDNNPDTGEGDGGNTNPEGPTDPDTGDGEGGNTDPDNGETDDDGIIETDKLEDKANLDMNEINEILKKAAAFDSNYKGSFTFEYLDDEKTSSNESSFDQYKSLKSTFNAKTKEYFSSTKGNYYSPDEQIYSHFNKSKNETYIHKKVMYNNTLSNAKETLNISDESYFDKLYLNNFRYRNDCHLSLPPKDTYELSVFLRCDVSNNAISPTYKYKAKIENGLCIIDVNSSTIKGGYRYVSSHTLTLNNYGIKSLKSVVDLESIKHDEYFTKGHQEFYIKVDKSFNEAYASIKDNFKVQEAIVAEPKEETFNFFITYNHNLYSREFKKKDLSLIIDAAKSFDPYCELTFYTDVYADNRINFNNYDPRYIDEIHLRWMRPYDKGITMETFYKRINEDDILTHVNFKLDDLAPSYTYRTEFEYAPNIFVNVDSYNDENYIWPNNEGFNLIKYTYYLEEGKYLEDINLTEFKDYLSRAIDHFVLNDKSLLYLDIKPNGSFPSTSHPTHNFIEEYDRVNNTIKSESRSYTEFNGKPLIEHRLIEKTDNNYQLFGKIYNENPTTWNETINDINKYRYSLINAMFERDVNLDFENKDPLDFENNIVSSLLKDVPLISKSQEIKLLPNEYVNFSTYNTFDVSQGEKYISTSIKITKDDLTYNFLVTDTSYNMKQITARFVNPTNLFYNFVSIK